MLLTMADLTANEAELLTVAFSLHSNPGAYALLLGAGVSASSGILTAWEVLEDLIARSAEVVSADPTDPFTWYEETFGSEPTYEGVLERIAPTKTERQRLLRSYFEQSPEDRDADRKSPTPAHRAIARLVRAGAVRVIVTLNFDHLIEQALRDEGIEPTVLSDPADIRGMPPLHTIDCCVVHLHGSYLKPSTMLNTVTELKSYDPNTTRLLQRILEDYGLIIAGWSARHDPELRATIAAHYPSRFTLTWFEPAAPSEDATTLRVHKNGILVPQDADTGFGRLADGIAALTRRRARHPLTVPVAVETAKRELAGQTVAIGLHDRLRQELDALRRLPEFHLPDHRSAGDYEELLARVEEATRVPAALLIALAYWGDTDTDRWWIDELPRFASPVEGSGTSRLLSLRVVSGSMLFYAAGVAAVAAQRFDLLGRLFTLKRPHRTVGDFESLAASLDSEAGYEHATNQRTRVFAVAAPLLSDSLSLGAEPVEDAWQLFEVLRLAWAALHEPSFDALQRKFAEKDEIFQKANRDFEDAENRQASTADEQKNRAEAWQGRHRVLGDIGRLAPISNPHILISTYRGEHGHQSVIAMRLLHDLEAEGAAHPMVTCGLFDDLDSVLTAVKAVSTSLGAVGNRLAWDRMHSVAAGFVPMQVWTDSGKP